MYLFLNYSFRFSYFNKKSNSHKLSKTKMHLLIKSLSRSISYSIKSPLDLNLFKSPTSLTTVKQSLKARFRDENLADDISSRLQSYRECTNLSKTNRTLQHRATQQKGKQPKDINKNPHDIQNQATKSRSSGKAETINDRYKSRTETQVNSYQGTYPQSGNTIDESRKYCPCRSPHLQGWEVQ